MCTARIIYGKYLDDDHKKTIGGVQSYIEDLSSVLYDFGVSRIVVYQYANKDFHVFFEKYEVIGIQCRKNVRKLVSYIENHETPSFEKDILIFATDLLLSPNKFKHCIAIQHGIAFDETASKNVSDIVNYLHITQGALRAIRKFRRFKFCSALVCVDYNFLNWYRTQVKYISTKCYIIPNYSRINCKSIPREDGKIKIIFARRLVTQRGTRIFSDAIVPILNKYKNVYVTIAGTGIDESYIRSRLGQFENVTFLTYNASESLDIHSQHDIAVVPSKCSEGTSLSLLEAMAAGCAVICTNVGGMTNVVLDGYNGFIINPDAKELEQALECLITDKARREYISKKGIETVEKSFSFEKWKYAWTNVLESTTENRNV